MEQIFPRSCADRTSFACLFCPRLKQETEKSWRIRYRLKTIFSLTQVQAIDFLILFLFVYLLKIQFNPITSYGNEGSKCNVFSCSKYWLLWLACCTSGSYRGIMVWYQYFQKLICSNSDFIFFPAADIPYVTFVCHLRSNLLALKLGVAPSAILLFSFSSVHYTRGSLVHLHPSLVTHLPDKKSYNSYPGWKEGSERLWVLCHFKHW